MKEFKYLDYHTEYSCEGDLVKRMAKEACFGYVFNRIDTGHNVKYRIILYSGTEFLRTDINPMPVCSPRGKSDVTYCC